MLAAAVVTSAAALPADTLLTTLRHLNTSTRFIFGHQHTNFEGQNFDASKATTPVTRTDVTNTSGGRWPGLAAYNLDKLVGRDNIDFTPHVLGASRMGAVVAFHWEAHNPVTGGSAHDLSGNPIVELLPGGSANRVWTGWLDRIAAFVRAVSPQMEGITQMIVRPFHEMTGTWYWWGSSAATSEQYVVAFQYTRDYLVRTHNLSNLLFAFAPSRPTDHGDSWKAFYPSDAHTDIVCFDRYDPGDGTFEAGLRSDCDAVVAFADSRGKVAAICESGFRGGSQNAGDPSWWNVSFLETVLGDASCARGITYMQTWTNSAPDSYWVPLPGQPTAHGFAEMAESGNVLFATEFGAASRPAAVRGS